MDSLGSLQDGQKWAKAKLQNISRQKSKIPTWHTMYIKKYDHRQQDEKETKNSGGNKKYININNTRTHINGTPTHTNPHARLTRQAVN